MPKTFKSITVTKNNLKELGDNKPDYNLSVKDGEIEGKSTFINVGGGWLKKNVKGDSYISLSLANAFDKDNNPLTYTNKNGDVLQRKGYVLLDEVAYRELLKKVTASTGEAFDENLIF